MGLYAGITITGAAGYHYEIQYTMDLTVTNAWVTLTNLTLQAPVELWVDTDHQRRRDAPPLLPHLAGQ